jgi:hypothetical protein
MFEIRTAIDIAGTAESVWAALVDFPSHPDWNPFIQSIAGRVQQGARIKVHIHPPGGKGMVFRPTLVAVAPNRELRWLGRVLMPGIFDGEHSFVIEPLANGVRFHHAERFTGILVPFLRRSLEAGTRQGFEEMNKALKARVERGPSSPATR